MAVGLKIPLLHRKAKWGLLLPDTLHNSSICKHEVNCTGLITIIFDYQRLFFFTWQQPFPVQMMTGNFPFVNWNECAFLRHTHLWDNTNIKLIHRRDFWTTPPLLHKAGVTYKVLKASTSQVWKTSEYAFHFSQEFPFPKPVPCQA